MAKRKQKYPKPRRSIAIAGIAVITIGLLALGNYLVHRHVVNKDRAMFAQAQKEVEIVASQIVTAAGQPADSKDGGKCRYASAKFSKGPLGCDVYSYLVYGVTSPDDVNTIVQKAEGVASLHGSPWQFKAITEKPHQFSGGVEYSDNFVNLQDLFDTETKSNVYRTSNGFTECSISFYYYNTVAVRTGYPNFNTNSSQQLLLDIGCGGKAKAEFYPLQD